MTDPRVTGWLAGLLIAAAMLCLTRNLFAGRRFGGLVPGGGPPGLLHEVPPRVKLLGLLALAVSVAFTPLSRLWAPALLLVVLAGVARVPGRLLAARIAELAPLAVLAGVGTLLAGQPERFVLLCGRAALVIGGLVLLSSTTRLPELAGAARRLGCPSVLTAMFVLAVRYVSVLLDEGSRMAMAFTARAVGPRDARLLRPLGRLVGSLAVRSLERGDRISQAMLARGFTGDLPSLAVDPRITFAQGVMLALWTATLGLAAGWPT